MLEPNYTAHLLLHLRKPYVLPEPLKFTPLGEEKPVQANLTIYTRLGSHTIFDRSYAAKDQSERSIAMPPALPPPKKGEGGCPRHSRTPRR